MSQKPLSFYGQLNLTEIKEGLKTGNIKAQKIQTKKGEQIIFDINVWVHGEADQYNNNASVQMQLKKEAFEGGVKNTYYIGNLKYQESKVTEASQEEISKALDDDDLKI